MGNVKPPAEKSSTGGLKNTVFLLFVLDTPEVGTFQRRICTAPLASQPPRLLSDRAANYGSIIVWKYLKLHIQFSRAAGMKSSLYFTASSLASTIKICQTKNFAGSFGFSKSQRKWERLSARGKNGKEKPLLHGLLASM